MSYLNCNDLRQFSGLERNGSERRKAFQRRLADAPGSSLHPWMPSFLNALWASASTVLVSMFNFTATSFLV